MTRNGRRPPFRSRRSNRRLGVARQIEMGLHQLAGAGVVAGVERIHDAEMLVDRFRDAGRTVDPLDVEEGAQLVLALYRVEQIAVAGAARERLVEIGVEREQLARQRVATRALAEGDVLRTAAIEPFAVELDGRF